MTAAAIIPARMGSSRFPGKPLAKLLGRTMLEHVYKRTALCGLLDSVFVATCDQEIRVEAENFGASVIMTASTHERATDRIAEAAYAIDADLIIMVQGDEPMIRPEMIDEALAPFDDLLDPDCVNLVRAIESEDEFHDPNTIKVVMNEFGDALFMSRQPIPSPPASGFTPEFSYKQVCVIPFRREMLLKYANLEPSPMELLESIDMLRLIEHGYPVRMVKTEYYTHAVDTMRDLEQVTILMEDDLLITDY